MVVNLLSRKEHLSGPARCLACGHQWAAEELVGTTTMTCPKCGLNRGVMIATVEREGEHRHCECGCPLFFILADWTIYCPNCGATLKP